MQKLLRNARPLLLLLLLNAVGLLIIMANKGSQGAEEAETLAMFCGVMCGISIITYTVITLCNLGDPYLFVIVSMLSTIGIIMQARFSSGTGMKQMIFYLAGVVCYFVVLFIYKGFHKYLHRMTLIYWGISILFFIVTLLFGSEVNGAKNWISLPGGLSLQPSEFIRILFVLSLAAIFTNARHESKMKHTGLMKKNQKKLNRSRLLLAVFIAFSNAMCLFAQKEWGTALLFFAIYISFLFIYGDNKFFFILNILLVCAAAYVGFRYLSHIQDRVTIWMDPFADEYGKGYQIIQSIYAIGEGDFAGRGIGLGSPGHIPFVTSDFIFAAICEEMGVLGGIAVLMLYFLLVYRGFKIALSTTNQFSKAVAVGLSVVLGIQTFIIVGGVTKLIPLTGITLPFISMGGSSMLSTFIIVGILQAIGSVKGDITDEIE